MLIATFYTTFLWKNAEMEMFNDIYLYLFVDRYD